MVAAAAALASAPVAMAKGKPDLTVRSVSKAPAAVERTAGFDVTATGRNGGGLAKRSVLGFFLRRGSRKPRLRPDQAVPRLKARASAVSTTTLTVPGSVPLGRYRLVVCADPTRKVRERSEANNCKTARGAVNVTKAKKPPAGKSSGELIDAAVAAHKISAETGLVYKVFSAYDDPQLPPEFRGKPTGADPAQTQAAASFGSLSARAKKELRPFFGPPFAAGSWWALRHGAAGASARAHAAGGAQDDAITDIFGCQQTSLLSDWSSIATKNSRARIWYSKASERDAARRYADLVDTPIWTQLFALMGREPIAD